MTSSCLKQINGAQRPAIIADREWLWQASGDQTGQLTGQKQSLLSWRTQARSSWIGLEKHMSNAFGMATEVGY